MTSRSVVDEHFPYRVVRFRDGATSYFAGHHANGQPVWTDDPDEGVHYPDTGLAGTVQQALTAESGESLNVLRI